MTTVLERAYFAGLLDGEGHIGITRARQEPYGWKTHQMIVTLANTYMPVMSAAKVLWGGTLVVRPTNRGSKTMIGNLRWSAQNAKKVLQDLRPYLRIKAAQADLALAFTKEVKERASVTGRITEEEWNRREELRVAIRQLNRPDSSVIAEPYPQRPAKQCAWCGQDFTEYVSMVTRYCSNSCVAKARWQRVKARQSEHNETARPGAC